MKFKFAGAGSQPAPVGVPVSLAACHAAWQRTRRGKKPSANQLAFEARWLDRLQALCTTLRKGGWQPARTVSFVVKHPKTREIHAPDFADRVVHHLLVERLEKLYEPVFIHDSYANRAGWGSHAAVDRLQSFMCQRENMPGPHPESGSTAAGWYLQLDIHNFFNSIHHPTLYAMLCQRLALAEKRRQLPARHVLALRSLCHKLLARRMPELVRDPAAAALVPPHKRLCNAAPCCGLPVGNLSSQFFANVYLNALDQFVKDTLKVRHYLLYVDDFVLLASSREQLVQWQIGVLLREELRLKYKDGTVLEPCTQEWIFWATACMRTIGWCARVWRATAAPGSANGSCGSSGTAGLSGCGLPILPDCRRCWAATGATLPMLTACACAAVCLRACRGCRSISPCRLTPV